jgi:F5/8 type C domain
MNKFLGWLLAPTLVTLMVPAHAAVIDLPRDGWTATAYTGGTTNAFDGNLSTRWTTYSTQAPDQYFQIDAGKLVSFDSIELNAGKEGSDYPRRYQVRVSDDGINWSKPIADDAGSVATAPITTINFPKQKARFIRINQTSRDYTFWWSIAEVKLRLTLNPGVLDPKIWTSIDTSNPVDFWRKYFPLDGDRWTSWSTRGPQTPNDYYLVFSNDFVAFDSIELDSTSGYSIIQDYEVLVTDGGGIWRSVAKGSGDTRTTKINFPVQIARGIKIQPTSSPGSSLYWDISEMKVLLSDSGISSFSGVLDMKGSVFFADSTSSAAPLDGNQTTRWSTNRKQQPGQFIRVGMSQIKSFNKIVLSSEGSPNDYPRGYSVKVSKDGLNWEGPIATGKGNGPITTISFPTVEAKWIWIDQTGSDPYYWWSIHELNLYKVN